MSMSGTVTRLRKDLVCIQRLYLRNPKYYNSEFIYTYGSAV